MKFFFYKAIASLKGSRFQGVIKGVVSGIFVKGSSFFITMMTVPILLDHLGVERYGVWIVMISMLAWISLVDLGLANGLTPLLSKEFGVGSVVAAREYISGAFWMLAIISVVSIVLMIVVWPLVEWSNFFKFQNIELRNEFSIALGLAFIFFFLQLPLSITQRIYLAYQQGMIANFWQFAISLGGLSGIILAKNYEPSLITLVMLYSGTQFVINIANAIWLFFIYRPELRPSAKNGLRKFGEISSIGGLFLVNQVATLLVFQKDSLMVAYYLGPERAAKFSVIWQLFLYLNIINMLIAPYLGPVFGEAYAKKDKAWMKNVVRKYIAFNFIITLPMVALLILFSSDLVAIWVGEKMMVDQLTVVSIGVLTVVLSIIWPTISILNGTGEIKIFTIWYSIAAVFNLFLSGYLINILGSSGSVISTVFSLLLLALFVGFPQLRRLYR